jgi:hypothetical protein
MSIVCKKPKCVLSKDGTKCVKPNPYVVFKSFCAKTGKSATDCIEEYNKNNRTIKKNACDYYESNKIVGNIKSCPKARRPINDKCPDEYPVMKLNKHNVKCCYKSTDKKHKVVKPKKPKTPIVILSSNSSERKRTSTPFLTPEISEKRKRTSTPFLTPEISEKKRRTSTPFLTPESPVNVFANLEKEDINPFKIGKKAYRLTDVQNYKNKIKPVKVRPPKDYSAIVKKLMDDIEISAKSRSSSMRMRSNGRSKSSANLEAVKKILSPIKKQNWLHKMLFGEMSYKDIENKIYNYTDEEKKLLQEKINEIMKEIVKSAPNKPQSNINVSSRKNKSAPSAIKYKKERSAPAFFEALHGYQWSSEKPENKAVVHAPFDKPFPKIKGLLSKRDLSLIDRLDSNQKTQKEKVKSHNYSFNNSKQGKNKKSRSAFADLNYEHGKKEPPGWFDFFKAKPKKESAPKIGKSLSAKIHKKLHPREYEKGFTRSEIELLKKQEELKEAKIGKKLSEPNVVFNKEHGKKAPIEKGWFDFLKAKPQPAPFGKLSDYQKKKEQSEKLSAPNIKYNAPVKKTPVKPGFFDWFKGKPKKTVPVLKSNLSAKIAKIEKDESNKKHKEKYPEQYKLGLTRSEIDLINKNEKPTLKYKIKYIHNKYKNQNRKYHKNYSLPKFNSDELTPSSTPRISDSVNDKLLMKKIDAIKAKMPNVELSPKSKPIPNPKKEKGFLAKMFGVKTPNSKSPKKKWYEY